VLTIAQKFILAIGAVAILAIALCPPWVHTFHNGEGGQRDRPAGYQFVFTPPGLERDSVYTGVRVNWVLAVIQIGAVSLATIAGVFITRKSSPDPPRA